AASGNCSVSGSTVTPLQAGNCTITASQAGNAFWKAATPVPRSFAIVPAPIITQITPASAAVGSAVTIAGNNFGAAQGSSVVTFNGVSATSISSWSATSIVAVIPAGATTGNVMVTTLLSSNGAPFTVVATLAITTSSLPGGTVGTVYSQAAVATGGTTPYTWSVSTGSLPAGLSLNTSTGSITGTPSAIGTSNFTLRVADAGTQTATQAL